MSTSLEKITPPKELTIEEKITTFEYFYRRLAAFRNKYEIYALTELDLSEFSEEVKERMKNGFISALNQWAKELLDKAWVACRQSVDDDCGPCPNINEFSDTSTIDLPPLPSPESVNKIFTTILFLHITTAKQYSAYTRVFFSQIEHLNVDEETIVATLKNPEKVINEAQSRTEEARSSHADKGRILRYLGVGLGAAAGGVLIGVTGGLAAPLVGAGVTTILGWLGVGGTAVGLLASGLAGSSVVCGALFGAYGAKSTAEMVGRHTREVRDLAVVPVRVKKGQETLGVRLCVSGWLADKNDVTAPWSIFEGDDTFALQWEIESLKQLSDALYTLIKSHAWKYVKMEVIKRTVFASFMAALSPLALLKIGEIIDNPWMNARALAIKAGAVLGDLLSKRAFGNRPVTLCGYSLGSLVIFEALRHLAKLPISESFGIVQDVFLFGTPATAEPRTWAKIRRVVAGRVINGYAGEDYVLAILSRASDTSWRISGLTAVDVQGVENVECPEVTGHTMWRGLVGQYLAEGKVAGVVDSDAQAQKPKLDDDMHQE